MCAWGVFQKIASGAKKAYDVVKNEIVRIAQKAVEIAKPFLKDTKFNKYVENVDNATKWATDKNGTIDRVTGKKQSSGMSDRYKRAQNIQPEFTIAQIGLPFRNFHVMKFVLKLPENKFRSINPSVNP